MFSKTLSGFIVLTRQSQGSPECSGEPWVLVYNAFGVFNYREAVLQQSPGFPGLLGNPGIKNKRKTNPERVLEKTTTKILKERVIIQLTHTLTP